MFGPEFFPTPRNVAHRMIGMISSEARYFLEPSAGSGELAQAIMDARSERYGATIRVDCIETDPALCSILKDKKFTVVGYDWLTYPGVCYYDAVIMNPPFSNGDEHLLRAWDFLHDGEIVCLLNDETIKNPYTESRRRLAGIIQEHGKVELLGPVFKSADRKTDVNVALVYLKKKSDDDSADLWTANPTEEKEANSDIGAAGEDMMMAVRDRLGNMEHYYNSANTHMMKAFEHLRKASIYMGANSITGHDYHQMLQLAMGNVNSARAEYLPKHRRDAWYQVFKLMDFNKWLDKKQTEQFLRDIETNGNIPFTAANIKDTLHNVFMQRRRLFEQSCANVFDELTKHYKGNTTGSGGSGDGESGWKSNDNYKVNEKLVFPYGCAFDSRYGKFDLSWRRDIDVYSDIDRLLAVLDGKKFEEVLTIGAVLRDRFSALGYDVKQFNGECESEFFKIRFFKKGTVHLRFKDMHLLEQFNKTAAAGKRWLGQNTKDRQSDADPAPPPMAVARYVDGYRSPEVL